MMKNKDKNVNDGGREKSLKKNFLYNLAYQIICILLPIITTPYISRILGAKNIGVFGFTQSISAYFILFGSIGISLYGQRQIAYYQNDKRKYSKVFWEILLVRLITMSVSIIIYLIVFAFRNVDYSIYYKILAIELFATCFDISWFFQGQEDFKKTVLRNLLVRIIGLICIFIFVKSENDLIIYFLIYSIPIFIGNVSLWFYLPKYLCKVDFNKINLTQHVKPALALFIPQIAIQIYTVLDKTMIGYFVVDKSEVGFYTQGQKIIHLLITVVTALGTVMLPRIANRFAIGDSKSIKKYIMKSYNLIYLFAFPMIFGLLLVANSFVPLFFGPGYDKVAIIMIVLSPIVLLIGMSHVSGMQYLIPTNQQKEFTISVVIGSVINFIVNIILINGLESIGAAIGTIIAELTVMLVQLFLIRKQLNIKNIVISMRDYLVASIVMFTFCLPIVYVISSNIMQIVACCCIGSIIYLITLLLLKNEFLKELVYKLKSASKNNCFVKHK